MFSARILFHAHRNAWRARCAVCTQLTHNGDNNEKLPLSPVRAEKTFHLSHRIHNGHNWVKCVTNWQSSESIYVHTVHCFHSLTVCAVLWLLLFLFRIHHSADDGFQRPIAAYMYDVRAATWIGPYSSELGFYCSRSQRVHAFIFIARVHVS